MAPPISVKSDDLVFSADYQVRAISGAVMIISVRCKPRRRNCMTLCLVEKRSGPVIFVQYDL